VFEDTPFWIAFGALFLGALARGQGTYWIARVVTQQALSRTNPTEGWRASVHQWLQGEGLARGRRSIERWGLLVIPLCYLTVGFQTLVLAAAGVMRIGWFRFTVAQVPGALAWALIYATVGFAAWEAGVAAAAGSPWGALGLLAILALGVALVLTRRARARLVARELEGQLSPEE
jgi:membrane protein DedA with SNARE-associated domain